jgi:phosphorylcholine metabolism protein LicD
MIIYTLAIEANNAMHVCFNYKEQAAELQLQPDNSPCTVDQDNYLSQYGFDLNDVEINYYKAHYAIWHHFINQTEEDYCLICEKTVSFHVDREEFEDLSDQFTDDWEVFFPFDVNRINKYTSREICVGSFGYFVGCPVYFISRKGAASLLANTTIKQPLDEELFILSISEKLVAYFTETGWFTYNYEMSPCFIARKAALSDSIFNTPGWSDYHRAIAQKIIKQLVLYCTQLQIDLVLHAGSLIGGIRHGGIMPWDDDIDFAVHHGKIQQLIDLIQKEDILKIKPTIFRKTNTVYYKCWIKGEGEIAEGYEHLFPFVDLWLFYDEEEEGYVIHKEGHRYPKHICMPFKNMVFEGSEVQVPNDPLATLDLQYPGWRKYIIVYPWCHRLKKLAFKRLTLRIEVDESGRLIRNEPV